MASDQPLPWANWRDRTLGAVLGLCGCVLLAAGLAAPALGDPRSELQQRLDAVGRMAADFTQAQYGTRGELLEQARGRVRLARPKFRWELVEPYRQVIVADGETLKVYDPDLDQVSVRPIEEALADAPLAVLTGSQATLNAEYEVARSEPERFSLRPLADDALIAEIILAFAGGRLSRIEVRSPLGQRTDVRLNRFEDASVVQPSDFELDLPEGVEVH
ncbi:MAG: outer membrane lipoprotein chaperone LolA [Gammaproteobacteria bacterium]|nr:outer membrane lipoprotein chaperone LolA [Gammaproteobacteria bacterium]